MARIEGKSATLRIHDPVDITQTEDPFPVRLADEYIEVVLPLSRRPTPAQMTALWNAAKEIFDGEPQ